MSNPQMTTDTLCAQQTTSKNIKNKSSPLKLPLMTYGMMPSGQTRSGLEVAALLTRWSLCLTAALLLLELLAGTIANLYKVYTVI